MLPHSGESLSFEKNSVVVHHLTLVLALSKNCVSVMCTRLAILQSTSDQMVGFNSRSTRALEVVINVVLRFTLHKLL